MRKIAILAVIGATVGIVGCYATVRRPMKEVWCYDPIWTDGKIGTQLAICETRDGEPVQVVIAPPHRHK